MSGTSKTCLETACHGVNVSLFFESPQFHDLVLPPSNRPVPRRLILVNYWLYNAQVFYFASGRLFLTGDNGSGKSTALTAAITMLLDGDSSPARMDPFGGGRRSLRYYLLGDREAGFEFEHRRAYVALEFGTPDGGFVTVGLGLQATQGSRDVQKWGFTTAERVGFESGLSLVTDGGEPLSRRQLIERLGDSGRVVEGVEEYAKLVQRSLYPNSSFEEYEKLMGLLLTLRGSKLGREVKPTQIEALLRQSLPRVDAGVLERLREGIEGIDRHQQRLDVLEKQVRAAVQIAEAHFEAALERARLAKARVNASKRSLERAASERDGALDGLRSLRETIQERAASEQALSLERGGLEIEEQTLAAQLEDAVGALRAAEAALEGARSEVKRNSDTLRRERERLVSTRARLETLERDRTVFEAQAVELETRLAQLAWWRTDDPRAALEARGTALEAAENAFRSFERDTERLTERERDARGAGDQVQEALDALEARVADLESVMRDTAQALVERAGNAFSLETATVRAFEVALEANLEVQDALAVVEPDINVQLETARETFEARREASRIIRAELEGLRAEIATIEAAREASPPLPADRAHAVVALERSGIAHAPLYRTVKPREQKPDQGRDPSSALEAALLASGVLTALVVPAHQRTRALEVLRAEGLEDALLRIPVRPSAGASLIEWLAPEADASADVEALLSAIRLEPEGSALAAASASGVWVNGVMGGSSRPSGGLRFIGAVARERERERQLTVLRDRTLEAERDLGRAEHLEAETREHLRAQETAWRDVREARAESRARREAQSQRDAARQVFDDRAARHEHTLLALASAQDQATQATRELETALEPLRLSADHAPFDRAALERATLEHREAREGHTQAVNARAQLAATLGAIEVTSAEIADRERDLAELETARAALEANRDALDARLKEMRAQLETPDARAWRERLNRVRARLASLRRELNETARELETARAKTQVLEEQLPRLNEAVDSAEHRLEAQRAELERARARHARVDGANLESHESLETLESNTTRLENAAREVFYALRHDLETPESFLPILIESSPRFTLEGQPVAGDALLTHLEGELEAASRLLSEEEARVFHDELVQDLADELHARIQESRDWVRAVRDTLAGLRFHDERLDLELERRVSGGLAEIVDGAQAPENWSEARFESARREVRETVRRLRENPDPDRSFQQSLEMALDYREWYGFRFYSLQHDRKAEITDRKFQSRSGGERSAVLYTFLFAALGARFDAMHGGPRLIGLDEAFAGMDTVNIAALYGVMGALKLSFIATSPNDIYLSRALSAASAYRLFRVSIGGVDGVSSIARLWDGSRALDAGAG
jgi:chromosome segregation ATPase